MEEDMARWMLVWASLMISIASLALGIANWWNSREQIAQAEKSYEQARDQYSVAKAQFQSAFKPLINFDTEYNSDTPPFGMAIENRGKGPALIKSITYWFNHTPYRNDSDVIAAAKLNYDHVSDYDLGVDDALGVDEKEWLVAMPKRYASVKKEEAGRFALFLARDLAIEVEYCSLAGECVRRCSTPSLCTVVDKP